ncbi:hypothetical protein ABZ766_37055 [Streptomyces sp. NPDC006670]|uniref:hypothetical protein n=1 Tax=Streptomyces sp. NPDC006670 TaxID=3154476 RepID=UPI003405AF4A
MDRAHLRAGVVADAAGHRHRVVAPDATGPTPGADPDRAGFSIAPQTARDQVIQAVGRAALDQLMPGRRRRRSARDFTALS